MTSSGIGRASTILDMATSSQNNCNMVIELAVAQQFASTATIAPMCLLIDIVVHKLIGGLLQRLNYFLLVMFNCYKVAFA